ncbi:Hypothetical protein A7982_03908 [Minicystis rosea]|nr:Hypothetical protein A7982_03908 [Minicystis rosea]
MKIRRLAVVLGRTMLVLGGGASVVSCGPPPATEGCVIPATGLPDDVYCTGLYANRVSADLAAGVQAYTPGAVLWSDGAEKHRYLLLPEGEPIDTSDLDSWQFPVGTKAWKDFKVDGKLVETRLEWKRTATEWASGTYVWNAAGTAATLNTETKGIILPSGYEIPTVKSCDKCHHGASDHLLGVEALLLGLPNAEGATLASLAANGHLSHPPAHTTVTLPEDSTGKAAAALGYLDVNCGIACHSTRGLGEETKLVLRLRASDFWPDGASGAVEKVSVDKTEMWASMINQMPTTMSVAQHFPGALRLTPGAHDHSLVWLVSHLRGNYQMPPLVSHAIDEDGTAKLAAWIDALPH